MKVTFYHPHPLPVKGYGGIERILFWHMKELVKLGHKIVLIGHPDSSVKEHGIEHIIALPGADWEKFIPTDSDIIHLNFNHTVQGNIPTINTIHGNGKIGEVFALNSVFVSRKHAEIHGVNTFIHNALDLSEYPFTNSSKKWERFLFLAKASWRVKNRKQTVKSCRTAGKRLEIIGGRWYGVSRYIKAHGILDGEKKLKLINECDAHIFPVRWHEPFGIAVIESMSQGLPVIGSPYGSLPELITSETGIIVNDQAELTQVLKYPPRKFNSQVIRKYVEDNFGITKYSMKYLSLYEQVINREVLNKYNPTYCLENRAEQLLPF